MLAILFQEKTKKKMLVFLKNAEKNASIIEKGRLPTSNNNLALVVLCQSMPVWPASLPASHVVIFPSIYAGVTVP